MIFDQAYYPVSIDLETLGLGPYSPIIQIGAALFNSEGTILDTFQVTIHPAGQSPVDLETVKWWLNQGDSGAEALRKSFNSPVWILEAMHLFSSWMTTCQDCDESGRFGGPVLFRGNKDMSWLENAFETQRQHIPFHFQQVHEQRQFMRTAEFLGYDRRSMGDRLTSQHDALNDAIWQAKCAAAAVRHMSKLIQG